VKDLRIQFTGKQSCKLHGNSLVPDIILTKGIIFSAGNTKKEISRNLYSKDFLLYSCKFGPLLRKYFFHIYFDIRYKKWSYPKVKYISAKTSNYAKVDTTGRKLFHSTNGSYAIGMYTGIFQEGWISILL